MAVQKISPKVNSEIKNQLVNSYGLFISTLISEYGLSSLELLQNIVRSSIDKAKKDWTLNGIPHNPEEYIWSSIVKNSNELFCIRVNHKNKIKYPDRKNSINIQTGLLFSIFNNDFSDELKKYLLLNILCGFSYSSLARIFGRNEKRLETEIYKEKKKITELNTTLVVPKGKLYELKIGEIHRVLKGIFNNGFSGNNSEKTLIPEFCHAAIRIAKLLIKHPSTENPENHALVSWMLLNASRLSSMQDDKGNILTLQEQNRSTWSTEMIEQGLIHLHRSAEGEEVTKTHLEAGIAAIHSLADEYRSTNWDRIVSLYDNYLAYNHCPSVELERAIAISKQKGPEEGIEAIKNIEKKENLDTDDLLYSALGNLNFQLHKYETAISHFRRAIDLSDESFDRSFYSKKIKICQQRIDMSNKYGHSLSF